MPRIVLALITSVAAMAASSEAQARPQLVMGIVIDGLDTQYLDMLSESFGNDGFNRLMREGVIIANTDYGTNLDATAATAMLMTGAAPSTTAVTSREVYDRKAIRVQQAMFDAEALGNFTQQTYSPRSLPVSTIADEVRISSEGTKRVYAIAGNPSQAILLAGHSANCAIWLDDDTGYWASSTYYKDHPYMLTRINRHDPLSARLDTTTWRPFRQVSAYPDLPEHLSLSPFIHKFPTNDDNRYAMYAASPLINTEITDIAGSLIQEMKLGTGGGIDMVNIAYSLQPYDYARNYDNQYELMDAYLRLDNDIARLITDAETQSGKDNIVVFIAATPPSGRSRRDDEQWEIPYGEFSTRKAKSLLNMYLMAKYGNGEWINAYHNGQFYLNHKLIEEHSLEARAVRAEAASFLSMMSGVDHVYTLDEVMGEYGNTHLEALQRSFYAPSAGDLYVEVYPGWETVDDISIPAKKGRIHYVKRLAPATAPVFILAPKVEGRTISTPTDARVIAPTVARLLRIRSPNGAALPPIVL